MSSNRSFAGTARRFPFFLIGLPLFALWHGINDFFGFIRLDDSIYFLLYAYGWTALFYVLARLISRKATMAASVTFFLLLVFLFFGSLFDGIRHTFLAKLTSYKVFPAGLLLGALAAGIFIGRRQARKGGAFLFLNWLMAALLAIEAAGSVMHYMRYRQHGGLLQPEFALSDTFNAAAAPSDKPDIYLLVLDEYARADALRHYGFDNGAFLDTLRRAGFYVIDSSRANYDFSPYAMSSCLNMRYVDSAIGRIGTDPVLMQRAVRSIADNETMRILGKSGYEIRMLASFENPWQQRPTLNEFGNYSYVKLFKPTFPYRARRDLGWPRDPLLRLFPIPFDYSDYGQRAADTRYHLDATRKLVDGNTSRAPRFVYTHLLLTHRPFLFDSAGNKRRDSAIHNDKSLASYITQVRVANREVLDLVAHIKKSGRPNSVIMVISDHGCRLDAARPDDAMRNLGAVYYPDGDYARLSPSQSPVNLFRGFFSKYFKQGYAPLPDSSVPVKYK